MVGMFVVFIVGLLLFLSFCVLFIVVLYFVYMGGVLVLELDDNVVVWCKVMLVLVFFVMGLLIVFLFYGYLVLKIGELYFVVFNWVNYVGGVFVILFGLYFLNVFCIFLL